MRIFLAYISLILLWATTPLAIQWSSRGSGFLFGATSRMSVGLLCVALLLLILRQPLVWHRKAVLNYLAVASQLYLAMLIVYWASQYIPSGWVSVVFGLVPLLTAIIAAVFLGERSLGLAKITAYLLGLGGLLLMFGSALALGPHAVWAIGSLVAAALLQAAGAVWVKKIQAQLPALVQVAGGLIFSVPAYALTWWALDGQWPKALPQQTLFAILYLGVLATAFGFALYYYILNHLAASQVALISLLSPVLALLLGHFLNHEPLTLRIIQGVSLILLALMLHELSNYRAKRLSFKKA